MANVKRFKPNDHVRIADKPYYLDRAGRKGVVDEILSREGEPRVLVRVANAHYYLGYHLELCNTDDLTLTSEEARKEQGDE